MKFDVESLVQPDHYFAIIDEVDSILIDEARTPLIISGRVGRSDGQILTRPNEIIPQLETRPQGRGDKGHDRRLPGR